MNQMPEMQDIEIAREIETPTTEVDVPPLAQSQEELTPEMKEWQKWLRNFGFIKLLIVIMSFMYVIDLFVNRGKSTMQEPFFEVLKTLLFTVSGYVFGRSREN